MLRFFGAGGRAAAVLAFVAIFVSPSQAAAQTEWPLTTPVEAAQTAPVEAAPIVVSPVVTIPGNTAPIVQMPQRTLKDLVGAFVNFDNQDDEQLCLAKAVYFEARGESLEGQLAVAEVVLNRKASGLYPTTICGVVTQRAQFSFIRGGRFPAVKQGSDAWHKALAIADIARSQLIDQIPANVLWYHASYVSPAWGRRLTMIARIGTHIFYG